MSEMYVSSYDEVIRCAFDHAMSKMPDDHAGTIKKMSDEICDRIAENVRVYVDEYLYENIKDDICRKAAEVAESMLRNALAGDSKELRNLFDFNDWYMKNPYWGRFPTQWKLLAALVERFPELLQTERIAQQDTQLAQQADEIARLKKRLSDTEF